MVLEWNTAAEWDGAASEAGVAHESVANTDHTDGTSIQQGYSYSTPFKSASLRMYHPMHEDSGTTANDISGNANDGTISGATVGVTGLLGSTAYSLDGTDDYVSFPSLGALFDGSNNFTVSAWVNADTNTGDHKIWHPRADYDVTLGLNSGDLVFGFYNGASFNAVRTAFSSAGSWVHVVGVWRAGVELELFVDATSVGTIADGSPYGLNNTSTWGSQGGGKRFWSGDIAEGGIWNTAFSASDVQALHDVVTTPGSLITAEKLL